MHKYSDVDIISLDDQQIKNEKGRKNVVLIKKDDEQKKYLLIVQDGEILGYYFEKKKDSFMFVLGTSTILTIPLDESFENIRSGSTGIIISLPKQKYLSYLLKFSNQEGKNFKDFKLFTLIYDEISSK
jgi:hypothetical protein